MRDTTAEIRELQVQIDRLRDIIEKLITIADRQTTTLANHTNLLVRLTGV